MRAENFDYWRIVEVLQGQCILGLEEAIEQEYPGMTIDDLTETDYGLIDMNVFLCEQCGWWCEGMCNSEAEEHGVILCDDCAEEEGYTE